MIQIQSKNPCPKIFQENPFEVKTKYVIESFVSTINRTQIGIYQYCYNTFNCQNRYKGEILMFLYKEGKWEEWFRVKITSKSHIQLLCFANNNTQLLFHKEQTNCIESLSFNSTKIFGIFQYEYTTIKNIIKFPTIVNTIIPSNNQKSILIITMGEILLLDVNSKKFIFTSNTGLLQGENINFFNDFYLIQTKLHKQTVYDCFEKQIGRKILFYNIRNQKVEKILYLCRQNYLDVCQNINIQQLNCKNLGFLYFQNKGIYTMTVLNITNLKFIRKIMIEVENHSLQDDFIQFLGISQRFILHRLINNKIGLHVMDVVNFNVEISYLNPNPSFLEIDWAYNSNKKIYNTQILMVEKQSQQQTQFWLTY